MVFYERRIRSCDATTYSHVSGDAPFQETRQPTDKLEDGAFRLKIPARIKY